MNQVNYNKAKFLISAGSIKQLPPDDGIEVAFVGRSNSGKSSAINVLTKQKKLARTSKTPGRTQLINFFVLDEKRRLVDLPGYGYAKVSEKIKLNWQELVDSYLRERKCLHGLVLIMDVRHPLRDIDKQVLIWAAQIQLPVHILLSKADKLSRGVGLNILQKARHESLKFNKHVTMQLFSILKDMGCDELEKKLAVWFGSN